MKTKAELDAEARAVPRTPAEQIEYDAGAELARTGQPLPPAASPATRQGYQGHIAHVALRGQGVGERRPVTETQADRTTVEQNEYEHGAYLARDGKPLPAAASAATRHGFQAATERPSNSVTAQNEYDEYERGVNLARNARRLPRSASPLTRQGYHSVTEPDPPLAPDIDRSLEARRRAESGNTPIDTTPREPVPPSRSERDGIHSAPREPMPTEYQRTEAQRNAEAGRLAALPPVPLGAGSRTEAQRPAPSGTEAPRAAASGK